MSKRLTVTTPTGVNVTEPPSGLVSPILMWVLSRVTRPQSSNASIILLMALET